MLTVGGSFCFFNFTSVDLSLFPLRLDVPSQGVLLKPWKLVSVHPLRVDQPTDLVGVGFEGVKIVVKEL